ncbi:MAG: Holliday junction resolvase RuvX [Nitrospinota bacterium]
MQPPAQPPKRILIVDDEPEHVQFIERYLREQGHLTETAHDGFEALAKVQVDIDLVLLDVRMPRMDGFEVARRIRSDPAFLDIPIIMVTVLGNKDDRLRAVEAGANDFISKPVDIVELRVRTNSLLKLKEARDQLRKRHDELESAVEKRTGSLKRALQDVAGAQRGTYEAHLDTIRRTKFTKDAETLARLIAERAVGGLVIGLPVSMDGSEGPAAQSIRQFAANLDAKLGIPIAFWDERLSTSAVQRVLVDEADMSRRRRAEVVDKMAAAYILQGAIDSLTR